MRHHNAFLGAEEQNGCWNVAQRLSRERTERKKGMSGQYGARCANQTQSLPLILVVEADETNAEMLKLMLSQELPDLVTCVNTGKEALQMVAKITPDLLALDCTLRDMSGFDLSFLFFLFFQGIVRNSAARS